MATSESGALPPRANVIKLSQRDMLDYRAVQRTFDGAYARTALGQLCYATIVLRLFQPKFFYIGLVYAILGMGLIPVAIFRYHMAVSNAQRFVAMQVVGTQGGTTAPQDAVETSSAVEQTDLSGSATRSTASPDASVQIDEVLAPDTVHTVLRESFVTAGSVVAGATAFIGLVEVALLVLILRL